MTKNEKSILRFGLYFMVLGILCSCMAQLNFFSYSRIVGPICVVLMCSPRLIYPKKKWSSVLLMISAILTTLALLCFDAILILFSGAFGPLDVSGAIFIGVITVIMLLSCYLCYRLCGLLFKSKEAV